ncbi:FtsQ-type POTRA domain-containing protein [Lyngbya aestuarii]|uniref:FtsQ-type POTRA domain-containing protein n=1 Tax=Lyngbya aestuarii TaxID=118322 RepID=UPI00403D62F1
MTNIASVSQAQLVTRRKKLRRSRQIKSCQALWRSLLIGSMASSLVWTITLPGWVIHQPEQVVIEGNDTFSTQAIRSLLPLSYPQSLVFLEPQELAAALESRTAIAKATVSRQLLPPGLTIQIEERQPVAVSESHESLESTIADSNSSLGLLDEQGIWMSESSYRSLQPNLELPTLKVIGSIELYRPYWSEFYQAIRRSPVTVFEVDWQDPANLILKTDLAKVYFGPYTSRFSEQLSVLDRMRELPIHIEKSQIAYIDLSDPESPAIQMK